MVYSYTTTQKLRSHLNGKEDKYLETPSNARIKKACNAGTFLAIATLVRRIFFLRFSKANAIQSIFKGRKKPWEGLSFRNEKSEDVTKRRTTVIITVINWFNENSDFKFCPYITKWKGKALPLWIYWATCSHKFRIYFWGLCFTSYLLHDDFNTDKVCNSTNPPWVGFVHMYKHCYLVTREVFYVTFHWESWTKAVW